MRGAGAAVACAFALIAGPALAEEIPHPATDFEAEWVDSQGEVQHLLRYSADLRMMLMEAPDGGTLHDMETRETIVWNSELPGQAMSIIMDSEEMTKGEPTGETRTVDGENCAAWQMKHGEVCLSEDYIPLQSTAQGETTTVRTLKRVAQDESLFTVPEDLEVVPAPEFVQQMMEGAGQTGPM